MITIEIFERGSTPRYRPTDPITAIRIDTSWPPSLSCDDAVTSASAGYAPAATTLAQMPPIIETQPATATLNDNLDQQTEHLLSARRVINRLQRLCAPTLTLSASLKSP
jgi:hypothetical protein